MSTYQLRGIRRLWYRRMRLYSGLWMSVIVSLGITSSVWADSVDVRCDIYPNGAREPAGQYFCVFAQRQGYITLDRADGVYYDFYPVENQPGQYQDHHGRPVYHLSGLGNAGMIFQLVHESVYVYWNTSGLE